MAAPALPSVRIPLAPNTRTANRVGLEYASGRMTATKAMKELKCHGRKGDLMKAEICLQEAVNDPTARASRFEQARRYYWKVANDVAVGHVSFEAPTTAKALLRLGEIPLWQGIMDNNFSGNEAHEKLQAAYINSLQVGAWLGKALGSRVPGMHPKREAVTEAKQTTNNIFREMSAVVLAQRCAIKFDIAECWLPTSTTLGQRTDTMPHGALLRNSWHMNIWVPGNESNATMVPGYRAHVATSKQVGDTALLPLSPDIQSINLYPDLRSYETQGRFVGRNILRECWQEQFHAEGAASATERLDYRTEQLLSILD